MKAVKERLADSSKAVRVALLFVYDMASLLFAAFFALYIRFDFKMADIDAAYMNAAFGFLPMTAVILVVFYGVLHLYNSLWSYASTRELFHTIGGALLVGVCQATAMLGMHKNMPRSYYFIFTFMLVAFSVIGRFFYRFVRIVRRSYASLRFKETTNIMLIGAGEAGRLIINEVNSSDHLQAKVVCAIDDDIQKIGKYLRGVPIVGG